MRKEIDFSQVSPTALYAIAEETCKELEALALDCALSLSSYRELGFQEETTKLTKEYDEYRFALAGIRDCVTDGDVAMLREELRALSAWL